MSKKKKIGISILSILIVITLALYGVGSYLVNYAIGRSGDGGNREVSLVVNEEELSKKELETEKNRQIQEEKTNAFIENTKFQEVSISSNDNLKLVGYYYPQDSHKWAIVIHGYRGNHFGMLGKAQRYYEQGFQVVAPDLRGCGESEGDYVGMGWPDRFDMLSWIDWILEQDPQAEIVLHGVSMGGATVMMTSGEDTPDAVKVFVEDCGYTSVWDIFSSELALRFHLPEFPILYAANMVSTWKADLDFMHASSVEQVSHCEKPMLFIHGMEDDFVPYDMLQEVYDAKPGENKKMISVEGAGHGQAANTLGEEYWIEVFDFVNTYIN